MALLALALLVPCSARAQSLFPARYVACREDAGPPAVRVQRPEQAPLDALVPIPRKHAPSPLPVEPLLVVDVAMAEPIPARRAAPGPVAPAAEEPPVLVASGGNDYKCLGYPRGRAGILRVVAAPHGTRWYWHSQGEGYRLDNMRAAGAFATRQALAPLRRALERSEPAGPTDWRTFEALDLRLTAARALADLDDRSSATRVLALLRAREDKDTPYVWSDSLEPLARLDPALGQSYAVEVLGRVARRRSGGPHDGFLVREVLPYVTAPSAEARAALERLSSPIEKLTGDGERHSACELMAARLRAGDEALRRELAPELAVDLRTERGVYCYSELIDLVFPGQDPDEVEALTHRWRYDGIITLLAHMRQRDAAGAHDPRFDAARAKLRAWLGERQSSPEIAGGRDDNRYQPEMRAKHLLALTLLGDGRARADLDRLVENPADEGTAPWVAAHGMLRLGLPGAEDRAAARLRLAITHWTERHDTQITPRRGMVIVTNHVRVVDELARRADPRFALGLLDREQTTREAALHYLARLRPETACKIVGEAAREAEEEAIQDAFWALSALGDACQPTMQMLALDQSGRPEVRGMAIEALAMMRHDSVPGLVRHIERNDRARAAKERARIIFASPE
jgi:hypothetical protein